MRASKEARTRKRWREQVARLIAEAVGEDIRQCSACGCRWRIHPNRGGSSLADGAQRSCQRCEHGRTEDLPPAPFDVAKAREYGERLVALAEHFEVFADWCRERGKGPENDEQGAFDKTTLMVADGLGGAIPYRPLRGGWPGPLARAYGWEECKACEGRGGFNRPTFVERCETCNGRRRTRKPGIPPGFANGRALARLGRRLLAALEGQPSECRAFGCMRGQELFEGSDGVDHVRACPTCRGTGHNLGGVLPAVGDSEATIIAVADAIRTLAGRVTAEDARRAALATLSPSQHEVYLRSTEQVEARLASRTRAVARGQHRTASSDEPPGAITGMRVDIATQGYQVGDLIRVQGYGVGRWAPRSTERARREAGKQREDLMPHWRRGELRHSEQRRERECRRIGTTADERRGIDYSELRALVERARPPRAEAVDANAATVGLRRVNGETDDQLRQRTLEARRGPVAPQGNGPRVTRT